MKELGKALFSIQKYMILSTKLNPQTAELIPDAYAYAWDVGLYPIFSNGEWHESVKDYFDVSEEKSFRVIKYIDEAWLKKTYYSFYELEDRFLHAEKEFDIDRWDLIRILRYTFLCKRFDDILWEKLLKGTDHPSEAKGVTDKFNSMDISLV